MIYIFFRWGWAEDEDKEPDTYDVIIYVTQLHMIYDQIIYTTKTIRTFEDANLIWIAFEHAPACSLPFTSMVVEPWFNLLPTRETWAAMWSSEYVSTFGTSDGTSHCSWDGERCPSNIFGKRQKIQVLPPGGRIKTSCNIPLPHVRNCILSTIIVFKDTFTSIESVVVGGLAAKNGCWEFCFECIS